MLTEQLHETVGLTGSLVTDISLLYLQDFHQSLYNRAALSLLDIHHHLKIYTRHNHREQCH